MAELTFHDSTVIRSSRAIKEGRNLSPDLVIYTLESASASIDRFSFASYAQDQGSLSSDHSQARLSGNRNGGRVSFTGRDQDLQALNKVAGLHSVNGYLSKKADKAEVHKHEDDKVPIDVDDEAVPIVSARNSFSLAIKECQERRLRSEALTVKESEHQKLASLDFSNSDAKVVSSSPRMEMMKQTTTPPRKSLNLPSPGTPNYRKANEGANKGWCSERVPSQTSANRRQLGTPLFSFNNGKNLPSKWEDAERWIFSPVAGDGIGRPSHLQSQKRPKSKSGPLGAPGVAYYAQFSPGISMYDESNVNSLLAAAGLLPAVVSVRAKGSNGNVLNKGEPCIARSNSVHGCSNLICQSSGASSRDDKVDDTKDTASNTHRAISRRDAATQMSPEGGSPSSSKRRSSFSASTPSFLPIREVLSAHSPKPDVRDVQVDDRVTVTRWSKKHKSRVSGKGTVDADNWKLKAVEARPSTWEVSEASENLSKAQREEAKITAWENLQRAKAEAAIRMLEMKLEKKRSKSIDKIMTKLRSAENKAQEMRKSVLTNTETQVSKTSKRTSFFRTLQIGSLSGCFTCNAF